LRGFETFEGKVDRWNIYDLETKGNIFNMDSGSAPAGSGAPEGNFVPEAMLEAVLSLARLMLPVSLS